MKRQIIITFDDDTIEDIFAEQAIKGLAFDWIEDITVD
jgi:hypothetical protein